MLNKNFINKNSQRGVSLVITFFIMIVILFAVLSISALLFSEVKVIRNIGNSMVSFYAGDSGVEKVLYYDRQVLPGTSKRGLCSMLNSFNNPDAFCETDPDPAGETGEHSIYCNQPTSNTGDSNPIYGCDYDVCNDCEISFNTTFDNRSYNVKARVYPSGSNVNFEIDSKGAFGGAGRQIQISMKTEMAGPPTCGGYLSGGHCWYRGYTPGYDLSCNETCGARGTESANCCEVDTGCFASKYFVGYGPGDIVSCSPFSPAGYWKNGVDFNSGSSQSCVGCDYVNSSFVNVCACNY